MQSISFLQKIKNNYFKNLDSALQILLVFFAGGCGVLRCGGG